MGPAISNMLDHITRKHPFGVPWKYSSGLAREILRQVLQGLNYLHRQMIVHSDLNPGNILLSSPQLNERVAGAAGLMHDMSKAGHVKRLDGLDDP